MTLRRAGLLAGTLLLAAQAPAAGQMAYSAGLGENADAATGTTSGHTAFLMLTRSFVLAGVSVGAGLPLEADRGSRWISAAGWLDAPEVLHGLGLLGSAQAFGYADPVLETSGGAATLEVQAYRTFGTGPALVRVRGGGRAGGLSESAGSVGRALAAAGADATVLTGPVVLRAGADLWAGPEALYPQAFLQAVASTGPVALHARIARWFHDDLTETGWSIAARVGVTDHLAIVAAAARPETDVLFFSPAQRSWSIGLRYGGGSMEDRTLPVPVFAEPGETVRLEVEAPGGGELRIAGTFNGWQPEPMRRESGQWVAELRLPPGIYEYAFVAADGTWFVPEDTPGRKADGFGGFVATIVVR